MNTEDQTEDVPENVIINFTWRKAQIETPDDLPGIFVSFTGTAQDENGVQVQALITTVGFDEVSEVVPMLHMVGDALEQEEAWETDEDEPEGNPDTHDA